MPIITQEWTYGCDCGEDFGSCDKTNNFIQKYNTVTDVTQVLWQRHVEDGREPVSLGYFTERDCEHLMKALT